MGLRLYQAPVESDIQSKSAVDKSAAQGRSAIRRTGLRRNPGEVRERRRRQLQAVASTTYGTVSFGPSSLSPPPPPPEIPESHTFYGRSATDSSNETGNGLDPVRRHYRGDSTARMRLINDRLALSYGERWAQLHSNANPSPARNETERSDLSTYESLTADAPPSEPYNLSYMRSTGRPSSTRRDLEAELEDITASAVRIRADFARNRAEENRTRADVEEFETRAEIARQDNARRRVALLREALDNNSRFEIEVQVESRPEQGTRFDGLGDRNRSLSPDGDHVWDTLLTTITPDPQPPSVGSSFASTSASAAASSNSVPAGDGSSRTSLTDPDQDLDMVELAPGVTLEQPCESGCEGTDTEGDDEEETETVLTLQRFPTSSRRRHRSSNNAGSTSGRDGSSRSYADVARSVTTSSEESGEYLGDMQRIVRNLARREDIPDEWWSEVGLSRTLSREASTA